MKILGGLMGLFLALGACQSPPRTTEQRMARVLEGLRPEGITLLRWSLAERMEHYKTPGVSIAVVDPPLDRRGI